MKHILVIADPVGEEQTAFQKALHLAKSNFADIHVVTFCYEPYAELQSIDEGSQQMSLKELVIDHAGKSWDEFISSQDVEVNVTHEIIWEKYIHNWILEHCKVKHYDMVIKTGRRTESVFYTPTDWQLFRELNIPIYCVSKSEHESKKIILVALDLLTKRKEKQALNVKLMEEGFKLSVQTDSTMHCCCAVRIPTAASDLDIIDGKKRFLEARQQILSESKAFLDLYDMSAEQLHIRQGNPWSEITSLADELSAQCIVLGSVGRKGIVGKLIGNTAEKVIHSADTDLMVI